MKILTQYEEKLTTVPRWGIVRTINKQSVADHCFLVALMAHRIAVRYFHYNESVHADLLLRINRHALLHDQYEAFTSDTPSPVKSAPGYYGKEIEEYFDVFVNENRKLELDHDTVLVVKLADYLESIRFVRTEIDMGNRSMEQLHEHLMNKFADYCILQGLRDIVHSMLEEITWGSNQDPLDRARTDEVFDATLSF